MDRAEFIKHNNIHDALLTGLVLIKQTYALGQMKSPSRSGDRFVAIFHDHVTCLHSLVPSCCDHTTKRNGPSQTLTATTNNVNTFKNKMGTIELASPLTATKEPAVATLDDADNRMEVGLVALGKYRSRKRTLHAEVKQAPMPSTTVVEVQR